VQSLSAKNLASLVRRIEAIEQRTAETARRRKVVRRIWQDGKIIDGYDGAITPDMLVINRLIVSPPPARQNGRPC